MKLRLLTDSLITKNAKVRGSRARNHGFVLRASRDLASNNSHISSWIFVGKTNSFEISGSFCKDPSVAMPG